MRPDGAESARHRPGVAATLRILGALMVGAAAITVLLVAQGDTPPVAAPVTSTTTTDAPSTTRSPVTTTTVPYFETLRAVLPDVDGMLMAAVGADPIQLVTWPGTSEKNIISIPMWAGPEIEVDRSGHDVAFLGPAMAGEDSALYVGNAAVWHPLAVNVSSFQWHARDPGRIAWAGEGLLCSGLVHPQGGFLSLRCLVDVEGRLVGFDDTGFLLALDSGEILRLDADGVEVGRVSGDDASIGSDGRVLVVSTVLEDGTPVNDFTVADADLTRATHLDWAPESAAGEYGFVAWSPASSPPELAFLVSLGGNDWQLQRWSIGGRLLASPNLQGRYWNVEWDWSGRYLLAPGEDEHGDPVIHIYDTDSRQHVVLGATDTVQDIHLVRDPYAPLKFDLTSVLQSGNVK